MEHVALHHDSPPGSAGTSQMAAAEVPVRWDWTGPGADILEWAGSLPRTQLSPLGRFKVCLWCFICRGWCRRWASVRVV